MSKGKEYVVSWVQDTLPGIGGGASHFERFEDYNEALHRYEALKGLDYVDYVCLSKSLKGSGPDTASVHFRLDGGEV
ncbi:hypothetical protein ABIE64_002673 [Thalassospira sp. MBR-102]|jgi:hypothetical protein